MAIIQSTTVRPQPPGTGGQSLVWHRDDTEITFAKVPPSNYAYIEPSHEPLSETSIAVWFDGVIVNPSEWVYDTFAGFPAVRLLFPTDPALSADGLSNKITIVYPSIA